MRLASVVTLALLMQTVASAGMVEVTGSGAWNSTAPTSIYSAPNATWSFSFAVPNPLDSTLTSSATGFSYLLNGSPISDTLAEVGFFKPAFGGLFDLFFTSGGIVSLYGAQVYDTATLALFPGVYRANIDLNGMNLPNGSGSGTVTLSAVPEPSTIVTGGLGLFAVVGLAWRRRRRLAT